MQQRWRKRAISILLPLCMVVATLLGGALAAHADTFHDYPSSGALSTYRNGSLMATTFSFELTSQEVSNLRSVASYLEIDFHLQGFAVPAEWDYYSIQSTNLPGAIHDVAASDVMPFETTPGVTRITTADLQPGIVYYATLTWANTPFGYPTNITTVVGQTQSVSITWVPSYWANSVADLPKKVLCDVMRNVSPFGDAWCIFPVQDQDVRLWDAVTGLRDGQLSFADSGSNIHRYGNWSNGQTPTVQMVPYLTSNYNSMPLLAQIPVYTLTPTRCSNHPQRPPRQPAADLHLQGEEHVWFARVHPTICGCGPRAER